MDITDFCKKHGLTPDQFYGKEKIEGSLYLRGLTSVPDGFNPTVGGSLDLRGLTSVPDGFNPTVGGSLYLEGLTSIPDGFNPTVGGSLDLRGLTAQTKQPISDLVFFQGGAYILADDIFAKVVRKKGGIYVLCKINSAKEFYLVTDGKFSHAHGDSLKEAKEAFKFKIESKKIKSDPITLETVVKIHHYRIITGACEFGVKNWMESNIPENKRGEVQKNGIKVKYLLPILEKTNAYGLARFKAQIKD